MTVFASNEKMLGIAAGVSLLSNSADNVDKSGTALEAKGIYSIDSSSFNYDLGLGYQQNELKGDLSPGTIKIKTHSVFLEADAKYKLTPNVYVGPGLKVLGGTDSSFKESEGESSVNALLGLKAQYDFLNTEKLNYRLEASVYSTVQNPQNIIALVGLNFGFKDSQSNQQIKVASDSAAKEHVSDLKIVLKSARVLFKTDAYEVDAVLKEKLVKLAKYLNSDNNAWARIKISGHTDNQGSLEYNKDLSQKRSDSIRSVLVANGVDPKKVEATSYSYLRPLASNDTEEGRAKNRRTEVEFFGIKNRDLFNEKIVEILQ